MAKYMTACNGHWVLRAGGEELPKYGYVAMQVPYLIQVP